MELGRVDRMIGYEQFKGMGGTHYSNDIGQRLESKSTASRGMGRNMTWRVID